MDIPDTARQAAVWARVYADPTLTEHLPAQLAKWIADGHGLAVSYYYLAGLVPRDGPALRRLAQNCAAQTATLCALYVALTHRQPPKPTAEAELETDPALLFSALYRREAEGAQSIEQALDRGAHDEILRRQAERQRLRAAELLEIGTRYL